MLVVDGRSALFVEEHVSVAGNLEVEMGPEGELDLFIGGLVSIGDIKNPQAMNRPARLRLYVGGEYFHSEVLTDANLCAPHAAVTLVNAQVHGAILAKDIVAAGATGIHYDSSVRQAGSDCE